MYHALEIAEPLEKVFLHLTPNDVAQCHRVCKIWGGAINGSKPLQTLLWNSEKASDCMVGCAPCKKDNPLFQDSRTDAKWQLHPMFASWFHANLQRGAGFIEHADDEDTSDNEETAHQEEPIDDEVLSDDEVSSGDKVLSKEEVSAHNKDQPAKEEQPSNEKRSHLGEHLIGRLLDDNKRSDNREITENEGVSDDEEHSNGDEDSDDEDADDDDSGDDEAPTDMGDVPQRTLAENELLISCFDSMADILRKVNHVNLPKYSQIPLIRPGCKHTSVFPSW